MAVDLYLPNHVSNQAVVNGTNWYSSIISLAGVAAVMSQIVCTNGAAGQLYILPTNADLVLAPWLFSGGTPIYYAAAGSGAISANGTGGSSLTLTSNGIGARGFALLFQPSASGNISVATNLTRIAN